MPQIQSKSALVSGLKQSAFQQTDTPIKRALSEACCAISPALSQAQESSLPSVFAAIPHQRSPLQTRQTTSPFPSPLHTLTHTHTAFLVCLKQPRPHLLGIFPCARLAQVKARQSTVLPLPPLVFSVTDEYLYLTVLFDNIPLWCGEAEPQRLVCLTATFQYSRVWAQQPSTCKDRK